MKKLLLVDNLSYYNLFFLLIYRLFGFKVIYLNSNVFKNKNSLIYLLESLDIKSIDYSTFKNYDFELSFNLPYTLARDIHDKIITQNDYKKLNNLLNFQHQEKAEIALVDMIRKYIGTLSDIFICADYYTHNYNVYLWHKRNFIINKIESKYKNLNNSVINFINLSFSILYRLLQVIISKLKTRFKRNIVSITTQKSKKNNPSTVIYFPHKGLRTANSYEKNFFYSDKKDSPLYQQNIEHIEYGILPNTQEYKSIEEDYVKKELNHRFIPRVAINSMMSLSIEFMKITKSIPLFSKNILILSLFINVKYYLRYMQNSKNSKVAIIGYDYLFPKALALTLDILKIHTVSYQERYLSAFVGLGAVTVDTYFMWNARLAERIESSKLSFIGEAISIGCVKLELFDIKSDENIIKIKQKYKKVVIAFDYHSAQNKFDNQRIVIANWKNNLIFYRDMIKLAVAFPDIYIIIRGKDAVWCDMKVFDDIYNIIESIDNIEVNREFSKLNVSYQLIKDADLVIGRYTSLMEESLAYGVPAISCDYGCNFNGNIEKMYDGDSCFRFVSSFNELKESVNYILNKETIDFECIKSLYKTNRNPKEIILDKIEKILERKCH